jgi:oligopeptide transport system substrate-binding protein
MRPFGPVLAIALGAAALAGGGCRKTEPEAIAVTVISDGQPGLVDPAERPLNSAEQVAMLAAAQGLVRFDARGEIVPGLAERWNVSDDGLSYIFRLGTGEWPDGRKIVARDVTRHLKRQLRRGSRNSLADTLGAVEEIVAMTDRVIEIRLASPRPNLLALLAQPELGIVRNGLGSGPFTIGQRIADAPLPLIYRERVMDAPDRVERIELSAADARSAIARFAAGRARLVLGGTVADLPLAQRARLDRSALRFDPVPGLFGLVPTRSGGSLADPALRRLLTRAVNREALIQALDVPGLVGRTTVLQVDLDGIAELAPVWSLPNEPAERDPVLAAEARALFGEKEPPELIVDLPEGPGSALLLERLRADWGALGIPVRRAGPGRRPDLRLIDRVAPSRSPAWFVRSFRCGVVPLCLEEADTLMESARATVNATQRAALLAEAARLIDSSDLFIPLAAPVRWSLIDDGLPGFVENNVGRHPLTGLGIRPRREGR